MNEKVFDEMIKKRLRKEIQECEAIGLQLDETSDIQNKERLVIMAKLVKKGKVLTRLLDLFWIEELDAKGIFKKLKESIKEWKVEVKKWVALNTDGASVMTGKLKGLVKLVEEEFEHVVHVHCLTHRLNLAVRETFYGPSKNNVGMKEYRELEAKLKLTRKILKSSTKSWGALTTLANQVNDAKKKPTAVHDIRWLSLHDGSDSFLGQLFAILTVLVQIAEDPTTRTKKRGATARGLYKYWTRFSTLSFLCVICDLTEVTNVLSKLLQRREIEGFEILRGIEDVETFFEDFVVQKRENERIEIDGSRRLDTLVNARLINKNGRIFLKKDTSSRSTALGSIKTKQADKTEDDLEEELGELLGKMEEEEVDWTDDDEEWEMPEKTFELCQEDFPVDDGIPIKYTEKDQKAVAELGQRAKTRLQAMFKKRFPDKTRTLLRRSKIFFDANLTAEV